VCGAGKLDHGQTCRSSQRSFGRQLSARSCSIIERARRRRGAADVRRRGFYLDGEFFGIAYEERLYFRVSPETIGEYTSRKMKPFAPFGGKRGESRGYYEVPVEIIESSGDLIKWARAAQRTPPLSSTKKPRQRRDLG
jgi:TfoX/Sxy family transcriptional regulator of competence genes